MIVAVVKEHVNKNSHIASSSILLMRSYIFILFIKRFSISLILYQGSSFINLGFLIKEDFWYVVLILESTNLNVCITFMHVQKFSSIWKIS